MADSRKRCLVCYREWTHYWIQNLRSWCSFHCLREDSLPSDLCGWFSSGGNTERRRQFGGTWLWPLSLSCGHGGPGSRTPPLPRRIPWPGTTSSPSRSLGRAWQCWGGPGSSWSAPRGTVSAGSRGSIASCRWFWWPPPCRWECAWLTWLWRNCPCRWFSATGISRYVVPHRCGARRLARKSYHRPTNTEKEGIDWEIDFVRKCIKKYIVRLKKTIVANSMRYSLLFDVTTPS